MASVVRLARLTLLSDCLNKDDTIRHAFDCLRESGIQPLVCDATEPSIWVAPEKKRRALTVLLASGLQIKEL